MANTRDVMGDQACLDALVAGTLASFEDDGVIDLKASTFEGSNGLTNVTLPNVKSLHGNTFALCSNLEVVDMLGGGSITGADVFQGCGKLKHLVLRSSTITSASLSGMLRYTEIDKDNGAVYVPQDMVETYKSNVDWGKYIILPISAYPASSFVNTITDTWAQIAAASLDGTYDAKYEIGDEKSLDLGTEGVVDMVLVGKDVDALASDPTQTAHMTWVSKQCLATTHRMNPPDDDGAQGTGANGGWEHSEMRSYLADTIRPLLPSNVATAIKPVVKNSFVVNPGESTVTLVTTTDSLWIPSMREIGYTVSGQDDPGPRYKWFNRDARRKKTRNGSATSWWTRTILGNPYQPTADFYLSHADGDGRSDAASVVLGVCIGFCI